MVAQEKQLVIQSNPLVSAQYKLDMVEQKVLRYLISMIMPHHERFEKNFYRVQIKELQEYLGWDQRSGEIFDYIKRVADRLRLTTIKIKKPDVTIVTSWLASYKYPHNKGWIEFEFSTNLESELLRLKEQFTRYYLKNISKLKSQYSIRLYEIIRQYADIGQRTETIESLKAMLGIDKNEYKQYEHFKSRIIIPAHKEINQKTDVSFEWRPIKEARKVIGIIFYDIKQKTFISNRILSLIPKKFRDSKQVLNTIQKYIELCGENYIIEKLQYTNSRNPKRWADYLYSACEYNYGEGYTLDKDNETRIFVEDPQAKAAAEQRKKEEEKEKKIKEEYAEYRTKTVEAYLATLNDIELQQLKENFEKSLSNNFLRSMFKTDGFNSLAINIEYTRYVYEHHIPMDARLSFSDFSKKYMVEAGSKEKGD